MAGPKAPAGWYPDETDANLLRYWDGDTWTEHTAPASAPPAPVAHAEPASNARPDPYCKTSIADDALRCPSCSGELKYCPS